MRPSEKQIGWLCYQVGNKAKEEGRLKPVIEIIQGQEVNRAIENFAQWLQTKDRMLASDLIDSWKGKSERQEVREAVYAQIKHLGGPIV